MSESELKPCPFCGGADIETTTVDVVDREGWPTALYCNDCAAQSGMAYCNPDDDNYYPAKKNWNTRPREAELEREVERLRGIVAEDPADEMLKAIEAEVERLDFMAQDVIVKLWRTIRHKRKWAEIARGLKKSLVEAAEDRSRFYEAYYAQRVEVQKLKEAITRLYDSAFLNESADETQRIAKKALEGGDE